MSDLINLWSESDRNIIGDDSTPTLTLENTSSGAALQAKTTGGTGSAFIATVATSNSTVAPVRIIASGASSAFFDFRGAVISTASLGVTGANVAGLVRVWYQGVGGNAAGWMPIYLDAIAK